MGLPGIFFFFFNDTATTEIYTLSLHDALPICPDQQTGGKCSRRSQPWPTHAARNRRDARFCRKRYGSFLSRSEEHTSELQSQSNLVCRLLLAKNTARRRASS